VAQKNLKKRSKRDLVHDIIFEAESPAGKTFDVALLILIVVSIIAVMLETIPAYQEKYGKIFNYTEWLLTIFFTIEYFLRIYSVNRPKKYIFSFFGLVDLLSIVPTYLSIFFAGTQSLLIIRALRLMRVFRVFKLVGFLSQGQLILGALRASRQKIAVFMLFILLLVCIFGSVMYLVETGSDGGFDSIPRSVYWAIVTLTTVGYGDISPQTPLGQFIASLIMIMGYAIIAVPTGIVTGEIIKGSHKESVTTQSCQECSREGHDSDAVFCKYCGSILNPHFDEELMEENFDSLM
jgi:voltage-gated potassium channel